MAANDIHLPEGTPVTINVVRQEPPPTHLSQENCHLRGLPPAKFLRALRDSRLPVAQLGNLRVVEASAFDAWLRARATTKACAPVLQVVSTEDQELEASGLRRRKAAR